MTCVAECYKLQTLGCPHNKMVHIRWYIVTLSAILRFLGSLAHSTPTRVSNSTRLLDGGRGPDRENVHEVESELHWTQLFWFGQGEACFGTLPGHKMPAVLAGT